MKTTYSATCPICTRGPYSPFRVTLDDGKIIAGCVDEFHTAHLVGPSATLRWHNRPEARKIRAELKRSRDGFVTQFLQQSQGWPLQYVHTIE